MSIGMMDADMSTYTLVPFNLELMKLSAYYKKKREIVILSPSFTPDRHQKFIYRKDYDDGIYPPNLLRTPNLEYGGYAFTNNLYVPLPPEVEIMKPDTELYERMEQPILMAPGREREKKKIFQNMMTSEHARLSLDGKTIWSEYPRQFKFLRSARNLMLHDYDLGQVEGSFEEVKKILTLARTDGWATRVGMKFPVVVNDGQSLLNWSSIKTNSTFYSLKYDGVIEPEPFVEWVRMCHEKAVYSQMEYHVTASRYTENHFLNVLLPQILRQVIFSRSYRVFFSLKYDKGYFFDPMWEKVLDLFNFYHNSYANVPIASYYKMITDDTLYDFAEASQKTPKRYYGDVFNRQDIRDIFAFVREYNYPLFKDFYECSARTLGGKI